MADADAALRAAGLPDALTIATRDSSEVARLAGRLAGTAIVAQGATVARVHGPVLAAGIAPSTSRRPLRSAAGMAAFAWGLHEAGVIPAVRVLAPADDSTRALRWDQGRLQGVEVPWMGRVLAAPVGAVLLGDAVLPALGGERAPLPLSRSAVDGLLRRDLGWEGVVVVDLRPTGTLARRYDAGEAAVRAVAAGADVLLGVEDVPGTAAALVRAVGEGRLSAERVEESARRVLRLRASLPRGAAATALSAQERERVDRALANVAGQIGAEAEDDSASKAPMLARTSAKDAGMSEDSLRKMDAVLTRAIQDSLFPGAAVAVGRRGRLVRLRGYGALEGPGGGEVSGESVYDLASLTKIAATTVSVMALVGEGRLDVRRPVRSYLPEWSGEGKDGVTVWNLLTHTSGLPAGEWLFGSAASPDAAWRQVLGSKLVYPPGTKVLYSDFGFIVLGKLVERISGVPLDRFAAERVYVPLGMSSTQFLPPLVLREEIAPTARFGERPYPLRGEVHDANSFRLGGISGHAGLFSTAADLAVLAQTMLNRGAYGPVRVFSPGVVDAFTRRQSKAGTRALGWDTPDTRSSAGEYFSARSYGHTGFTGTSLWIDPERELFVVLLTNRTYGRAAAGDILRVRAAVHDAAVRAITDQKIESRIPKPKPKPQPKPKPKAKPAPKPKPKARARG
jgi:CubicO group peptidase (beta-lactamase class C family)